MIERQLKTVNEMHKVALASAQLCAGYWFGFTPKSNPEQDPITLASFYKESGN